MFIHKYKFKISLAVFFGLLSALAGFLPTRQITADEIQPEPSRLYYRIDKASWLDPFFLKVDLVLDNRGGLVNAWQVDLIYSADSLALYQASTSPEVCPFSFAPVISPEAGTYNCICGNSEALPATTTVLTHLVFRKLDPQEPAVLTFGDGTRVLLADGQGTPLDLMTETHRIYSKK